MIPTQTKRIMIVCYSLSGATLRVAQSLAAACQGDIKVIRPLKEIPTSGFSKFLQGGFQALFKQRPVLQPTHFDANDYDLVIIGTPTWAGHLSGPMRSWLSQYDLPGKRVAVYCTYQGNAGHTFEDMRALLSAQVVGEHGFLIKAGQEALIEQEAKQWMEQIRKA